VANDIGDFLDGRLDEQLRRVQYLRLDGASATTAAGDGPPT
jgi:hypothetical protein